jgi:hypothetical protein
MKECHDRKTYIIDLSIFQSSDGARYVMTIVAFSETVSSDDSGMDLFWSTTTSLSPVGRMMVGHHISSKLIVMPGKGWKVMGVCSSQCTGIADVSSSDTVSFKKKTRYEKGRLNLIRGYAAG